MRVLIFGNIANNGYYVARLLRRAGIEADVLSYDNYFIMACPEWEELDTDHVPPDLFLPDWWKVGGESYEQPRWFAQGPFFETTAYLLAKTRCDSDVDARWKALTEARRAVIQKIKPPQQPPKKLPERVVAFAKNHTARRLKVQMRKLEFGRIRRVSRMTKQMLKVDLSPRDLFEEQADKLIELYQQKFPNRSDVLSTDDMLPYVARTLDLKALFDQYDVVQGHALDAMYPMFANVRPYVAFEHGTLRDSPDVNWVYKGPFYSNPIGRLAAISYAAADHVLITNADVRSSVDRLGIRDFTPFFHAFDESMFKPDPEARRKIHHQLCVEHLFLCPIRHDWLDKGTDLYIRALPILRERVKARFKACFMPWGREIDRSKALIKEIGCEDVVEWIGPFGTVEFVRWLSAADVVWDQVRYTSFSGLSPRSLAAGKATIASYDHRGVEWMFSEAPPILSARTVEEIVEQTVRALDPEFRRRMEHDARAWIAKHHSGDLAVRLLTDAYERVLARYPPRRRAS